MMMEFKEDMMKTFEMIDLGLMSYFLGIEVSKRNDGIFISQKKYTEVLLKKFNIYTTRHHVRYKSSIKFHAKAKSNIHYGTGKRILRYLQGTREFGIWYKTMTKSRMIGYTDSDWAGSIDDMESTSRYAFSLGSGFFSWASKKQATVAQSTAEAEYI
ncbi:uncharacterized protein LOC109788407 [Cajanus cajan]|uniref:uncharacterized protein LOC109788407 n=1 Tax=Cajanus cajan TaxID=3821 RepID=UPI00098D9A73|nr:uncharacterized protein LOC109788407 [Cajanus cajan]